jgi:hypothetical protein
VKNLYLGSYVHLFLLMTSSTKFFRPPHPLTREIDSSRVHSSFFGRSLEIPVSFPIRNRRKQQDRDRYQSHHARKEREVAKPQKAEPHCKV